MDHIKTISKTTTGLHYAIVDAVVKIFVVEIFVNTSNLSLLHNIFRTQLASMSTFKLICANALKRF